MDKASGIELEVVPGKSAAKHASSGEVNVSLAHRGATLIVIVIPFVAMLLAIYGFWGWGFSWTELAILVTMYIATGLGITIGFHRLFTHRSFDTNQVIKCILGVLGSMAAQGPLLSWVATHRRHHQHSDQDEDPHSPHRSGSGILNVVSGYWHAHIGWMFKSRVPSLHRYVGDFRNEKAIRHVSRYFVLWVLIGLLLPMAAGGLITGTVQGALLGLLWGGLVRMFLVHHVTWSINSVCHIWGSRPFRTEDESRNNPVCGVLAFGEGWHNNHHAFPTSARHGLRWWQIDTSYFVICAMRRVGLAWNVRLPKFEAMSLRLR